MQDFRAYNLLIIIGLITCIFLNGPYTDFQAFVDRNWRLGVIFGYTGMAPSYLAGILIFCSRPLTP